MTNYRIIPNRKSCITETASLVLAGQWKSSSDVEKCKSRLKRWRRRNIMYSHSSLLKSSAYIVQNVSYSIVLHMKIKYLEGGDGKCVMSNHDMWANCVLSPMIMTIMNWYKLSIMIMLSMKQIYIQNRSMTAIFQEYPSWRRKQFQSLRVFRFDVASSLARWA